MFLLSRLYYFLFCFFFFKQKTAYEMRISDWSSDVCSSDLAVAQQGHQHLGALVDAQRLAVEYRLVATLQQFGRRQLAQQRLCEIGRASCRERVCQYV